MGTPQDSGIPVLHATWCGIERLSFITILHKCPLWAQSLLPGERGYLLAFVLTSAQGSNLAYGKRVDFWPTGREPGDGVGPISMDSRLLASTITHSYIARRRTGAWLMQPPPPSASYGMHRDLRLRPTAPPVAQEHSLMQREGKMTFVCFQPPVTQGLLRHPLVLI